MLRTVLILGILIPGLFAALRSRFAGLLLYLWFALFRPQEWMWMDISSLRPSLVIGLTLVVPCLLTGTFPDISHPLSVGAILFFISGLIAQTGAVDAAVGWTWLDFMFRLVLVCLLTVTLLTSRRRF